MSKEVKWYVDQHQSNKNLLGLLLTVLYFVFVLIAAVVAFISYSNSNSTALAQRDHVVNLTQKRLLPMFMLKMSDVPTGINISQVMSYYRIFLRQTYINENETYHRRLDLVPCSSLNSTHREVFRYFWDYSKTNLEWFDQFGQCPYPQDDLVLKAPKYVVMGETPREIIQVSVLPCLQTNDSECASLDVLKKIGLMVFTPSSNLDVQNLDNPVTVLPGGGTTNILNVVPGLTISQSFEMRQNLLLDYKDTDYISLPKWTKEGDFYDYQRVENSFRVRGDSQASPPISCKLVGTCEPYFELQFRVSPFQQTIRRKYTTIIDVFATVGGVKGLLLSIIVLVYTAYDDKLQIQYIAKRVHPSIWDASKEQSEPQERLRKSCCSCCSRKKRTSEVLKSRSLDSVKEGLNVVSIVKEMTALKMLVTILLSDQQRQLVPLLSIQAKPECSDDSYEPEKSGIADYEFVKQVQTFRNVFNEQRYRKQRENPESSPPKEKATYHQTPAGMTPSWMQERVDEVINQHFRDLEENLRTQFLPLPTGKYEANQDSSLLEAPSFQGDDGQPGANSIGFGRSELDYPLSQRQFNFDIANLRYQYFSSRLKKD